MNERIITWCCIICGISIVSFFTLEFITNNKNTEVGQVWIYKPKNENPFKKIDNDTNIILDIKNNYILFVRNSKDTISMQERVFLYNSTLVK